MADTLEVPMANLQAAIKHMKKTGINTPRRLHVCGYRMDVQDGRRRYPRAVYALGNKPDAPKPKREDRKIVVQRWKAKKRSSTQEILLRNASVFNLGLGVQKIRAIQRANKMASAGA